MAQIPWNSALDCAWIHAVMPWPYGPKGLLSVGRMVRVFGLGAAVSLVLAGSLVLALGLGPRAAAGQETEEQKDQSKQGATLGQVLGGGQLSKPDADVEQLTNRLDEIASRPGAQAAAARAMARARKALNKVEELRAAGDKRSAERHKQIAEAALCLASREIALEHARQALRAAERRAVAAENAAKRARKALEASLKRRAALRLEAL